MESLNWQKNFEDFDSYVNERLEEWKVPGIAIAVVKDGEVILSRGYGLRNIKENIRVTEDTIFPIGSASKAFTATAAGILVDEGKLDWDTPVKNYMPWFKMYDNVATERVTVRDMLCHRTGLPRHEPMWINAPFSRREIVERIQYFQPSKDFRSAFQYQNQIITAVGYIIEAISGMTWEQFVHKRIFEPLGMEESNFSVEDSQKMPDYSRPHKEENGDITEMPFQKIDNIGPAGSINSSVNEMANWLKLNLNKGKFNDCQIISEANISQLHTPHIPCKIWPWEFTEIPFSNYGLGWFVDCYRQYKLVNHGGTVDGFNSQVSLMPDKNIGMVILANRHGSIPLIFALQNDIYDRLLGCREKDWNKAFYEEIKKLEDLAEKEKVPKSNKPGTKPSHDLKEYIGIYENPGYGKITVSIQGESLYAKYNDIDYKIEHHHYDIFNLVKDEIVYLSTFKMNKQGDIDRLLVPFEPSPGVDEIEFIKL